MKKLVVNIFGEQVAVESKTMEIYEYNNEEQTIVYNALVLDGDELPKYNFDRRVTTFVEKGIVNDLESRLHTLSNPLKEFYYLEVVNYKQRVLDADKKILNKLFEYVRNNEHQFFDENKDWKYDSIDIIREVYNKLNTK